MKLTALLTALTLSASPAIAQDVVVECAVTLYGTLIDAETSNVVDSHKEDSTIVLSIDVKNKTLSTAQNRPKLLKSEMDKSSTRIDKMVERSI